MRLLKLTSPLMRGDDVRTAQKLLTKNVMQQNYKPGVVDGEYGEMTMRAAKRAHYWVGDAKPDSGYGARLESILSGKLPLTAEQQTRRDARLKQQSEIPLRVKALDALTTKLGTKESPRGSNRCWASEWYRLTGPWCAMAASWAYATSGSKAFKAGSTYAYCPFVVNDARAGRNSLAVTNDPQPGDWVLYTWKGQLAEHAGLFEKWLRKGVRFSAIEGNTAVGNDSNGGEVMRRERTMGVVVCFVHAGG